MSQIKLSNGQKILAGQHIKVLHTTDDRHMWEYRVDEIDHTQPDEYDRVKLSFISHSAPNQQTKYYAEGERTMTVEPAWFYAEPKRVIKILE